MIEDPKKKSSYHISVLAEFCLQEISLLHSYKLIFLIPWKVNVCSKKKKVLIIGDDHVSSERVVYPNGGKIASKWQVNENNSCEFTISGILHSSRDEVRVHGKSSAHRIL